VTTPTKLINIFINHHPIVNTF